MGTYKIYCYEYSFCEPAGWNLQLCETDTPWSTLKSLKSVCFYNTYRLGIDSKIKSRLIYIGVGIIAQLAQWPMKQFQLKPADILLFLVNNEFTRTIHVNIVLVSLFLTLNRIHHYFGVYIVNI